MMNPYLSSSDNELLERIRQGDEYAFTVVYRKYWSPLYQVACRRLHQPEIAEELVQELFVKLWKKREDLQIIHLEHYLNRSIKFAIIDYIRSQAVKSKFEEYYCAFTSLEDAQTENQVAYHDLSAFVEKILDSMPPKTRAAFQLSRLEGWPVSKIAAHLRLTDKAVEYHLSKSLKALRVYLKEFILSLLLLLWL
jgi:RNA polymerase sigma-70 factor (family 1)